MIGKLIATIRGRLAGRILFFMVATALQIVLGIAVLPLTTIVLTAADFGYFALMMSVATFAVALGDGGGSLALHEHYGVATPDERRRMLASFLLVTLLLSSILAIAFIVVWPFLVPFVAGADAEEFSWTIAVLTAAFIPLRSLSGTATSILSVGGRANAIAAQIGCQAVGAFCVTLFSLFVLHWGASSLFAGAVGGQVAALVVAAVALRGQPWVRPSRRWLGLARRLAPTAALAGMTDGVRGVGESGTIAANLSVSAVGYYSHARLYYGMLMTATNAIAHNIWSTSLAEARAVPASFRITEMVWTPVHIGVTLFGIGAVCFGADVVALLTNDRLTAAAALIPWLVCLALVALSGRAQNAVVYAHGAAPATSRARAGLSLVMLACLPLVMGKGFGLGAGLPGLIGVLLLEGLLFRFYLRWKAMKFLRDIPFQDQWAFGGAVAIGILWIANAFSGWSLATRGVILATALLTVIIIERRRLLSLLRLI